MSYRHSRLESLALCEIEGDPPMADAADIEGLSDDLHGRAEIGQPEALVATAEARVVVLPSLPPELDGMLLGANRTDTRPVVVVRPQRDRRRQVLALLHELAHWLLVRERACHSHGDVWCLTLALAFPMSLLSRLSREGRLCPKELAWWCDAPPWVAFARLQMPLALRWPVAG